MSAVTKQQRRTLNFIIAFIKRNRYSPSYQEIADGIGVKSKSGIVRLVDQLARRGAIRRVEGQHRSIEVMK
jgi:repressor LexA